jgi:predicted porin
VSGNVNYYTSWAKTSGTAAIGVPGAGGSLVGTKAASVNTQGNGLLPNFLSFSGTTRQNDLDVTWLISIQPGSASNIALGQAVGSVIGNVPNSGGLNNRQAFFTFGDKSWGSVKMGKDLGIFASDAILNDITLLGVGGGSAGSAGNTSLGRIGFGYLYADWKPQISYTTPNFNGLQATVGITKAFSSLGDNTNGKGLFDRQGSSAPAYEGKASYGFASGDVKGKVWVSGIVQHNQNNIGGTIDDPTAYAGDVGAQVSVAGFDLSGYYYNGTAIGTTGQFFDNYADVAGNARSRDSDGGYVQAKYTLPTKTIAAISWGISNLDRANGEAAVVGVVRSNEMWDAMLIHPLTKHVNLVAEYSHQTSEAQTGASNTANVGSVGGILFF